MMKFITSILSLVITFYSLTGAQNTGLENLTLNYSDFSYVRSIAVGFDYVYIGTSNGIIRYNISHDKWANPMTGIEGLPSNDILEIRASRNDDKVWARTEHGVYEYIRPFDSWSLVDGFPNEVHNGKHITPDFDYFAPPNYNYFNNGILTDQNNNQYIITDILDDGWSNLWIGTRGLGVLRADNSSRRMEMLKFGLIQNDVSSIHSVDGVLWIGNGNIGSFRSGITIFDWRQNEFNYIETGIDHYFYPEYMNDITSDDHAVYFATDNGILIADKESGVILDNWQRKGGLSDNQIYSILSTGDTLLIGTQYGLGITNLHPDSMKTDITTVLPSLAILSLEKVDQDIWIGTTRGTYRMDLETGKMGRFNAKASAGFGEIRDIRACQSSIWLATDEDIVSIDLETADLESFTETIQHGGARALDIKDSLVAAATANGLLLIFNGQKPHSYLYTINDGLISNDIRDLVFDGEFIWLATDRGLTRFWYKNPSLYY
jgi:ligand-binding sensor domain-containing protein